MERVGNREWEEGEGREGREGVGRDGKGKGVMVRGRRVRVMEGAEEERGEGKGRDDSTWIFVQGLLSSEPARMYSAVHSVPLPTS